MFAGTEVPTEGETFTIPIKATATGKIALLWYFRENEKLGDKLLEILEGWNLCEIEVKTNGSSRFESVEAPVTGYLVKIIKKELELVKEGETIAEMRPLVPVVPPEIPVHKVPPEIPEELYPFIG